MNAAVLQLTGLNLGAPAPLIIDQAVALQGGGTSALYRSIGAGVFNFFYPLDYIDHSTFTSYIQMALGGDVRGATNLIDAPNNIGYTLDSFGRGGPQPLF